MDPHDNQHELYEMALTILYVKSLTTSNSKRIIAPHQALVKKKIGDPYRIRTDVNGVRGRCLNHLTNGPHLCATLQTLTRMNTMVHLQGLEPGTY